MRDFSAVVFVLAGSVYDRLKHLSMSGRIAAKLVGHELPGWFPLMLQRLTKEPLSSSVISLLGHQNIDHVPVLIDRSPQITTLTSDRQEQFVNIPDVAQSSLLSSQRAGIVGAELVTPSPNRLIGDDDTSLGEQVFDVAKAESEPMVPGKGTTSRSFPPLRTVRESFPSHRSSLSRACDLTRFLSSSVYLHIKSPSVRNRERTTPMD